jgi:hypothetical protein
MVSNSPGFKKLVIRALGEGGRRSSDALGAVDTRIIIDERNDAVIDTLRELLAQSTQPASVAIFYGAAHMRDFEDTLRADFGLEPDGVRWDSAMSVDEWNAKRVRERLDQFRAVRQAILENDPNGSGPEVTRIDGRVDGVAGGVVTIDAQLVVADLRLHAQQGCAAELATVEVDVSRV